MSKFIRLIVLTGIAVIGLFLAACGPIPPGMVVHLASDGQSAQVEFTGKVDSIAASQWTISGYAVVVNGQTHIQDAISTGDIVRVAATVTRDGTVTARAISLSKGDYITGFHTVNWEQSSSSDTATPTPTDTPNGTQVEPSETSKATMADEAGQEGNHNGEMELVGLIDSISPDQWVIGGQTFLVGPDTKIDGTFLVGDRVHVHARINPDGTLTATEISPVKGIGSGHSHLEFSGIVAAIGPSQWTIGGKIVNVTDKTLIHGSPVVGDLVKVEALVNPDGSLTALSIEAQHKDDEEFQPTQEEFKPTVVGTYQFEFSENHPSRGGEKNPYGTPVFQGTPLPFQHDSNGGGQNGG
jgi:hypothetical protein